MKADENNDLIYGNAGAVIVLLNLYHLAQKDIYLQLACEAGNILIKNQNKGKWCCGNGQSLSGLSHGITGIIYALTKLNNEQFHIEYQKAIHSGLIYENTMYSDKYNNWLDNREEAKKEENSDNRCMAAWCHGAPGILLARSKMYNLVKDSSDYITGDIGNRFNSINQLNDILTNGFINIIIQGITSLVCLAVMTSISPYLTAFVLVVSIIQIAIMILLNGKNLIKTKEYIYSQSTIQGELIDTLENIMEIKCMGMDNAVKSNLQNSYSKLIERFKGKTRISNLMNSFSSTLNLIFPLMIYVIGSYSVKQGGLTIGQLIAYATLVGYFTAPFTTVVLLLPSINSIKEVLLRYKELMIFRENYHTGVLVPGKFENLKISSVSYCYNSGQAYALNNVSLDLRRGERIAIVGLSGSGKSTLIKAILGAVDINQGCIEINNYDIRSMSKEQIYKWFSVVTQNPMCLNASIRKNIDIIGDAPDEKIWKVLDIVALKEEVLSMPLGLDTLVGEGGQNISGGQKQRIAIARALLSDTEVVIFDEATSNLDQLTEKKIYDNLRSTNKTQIIITHRLSSIRDTDYIYVLNRGSIIEQGTHLDLMKKKGWYFESIQ